MSITAIIQAAKKVISNWEDGDLDGAVNELDQAINDCDKPIAFLDQWEEITTPTTIKKILAVETQNTIYILGEKKTEGGRL